MFRRLLGRANLEALLQQIHIRQKNIIRIIKERRTVKMLRLFRSYSALIVVISCALLVSATNFAAGKESSGFLFGYFGNTDNYESPVADKIYLQTENSKDLALVQLAQASTAPNPQAQDESDNESLPLLQGQALVAGMTPIKKDPEEDGGVKIYEVQSGDTVSAIAAKNHITINTILWANNLDNVDDIMPGDKLFILPVAGLSYTVKKGDNLDSIAKKYKAEKDKIIAYNNLPANGELTEGEDIMIPDGQKDIPAPTPSPAATSPNIIARPYESFPATPGKSSLSGPAGAGHRFPYGYCTWYVAQKRYIPWSGNAGTWLYHAKSMGYSTGRTPRPGAIMVSSESWWGHVAIVEKVNSDGTFTISEMNYKGFARKDFRTVNMSRIVKGFIY